MDEFKLDKAFEYLMNFFDVLNKYIDIFKFWILIAHEYKEELENILVRLLNGIYVVFWSL